MADSSSIGERDGSGFAGWDRSDRPATMRWTCWLQARPLRRRRQQGVIGVLCCICTFSRPQMAARKAGKFDRFSFSQSSRASAYAPARAQHPQPTTAKKAQRRRRRYRQHGLCSAGPNAHRAGSDAGAIAGTG
ncbi:uncharacterized protein BDZ99DRAFT_482174 [Mytilinidion resinicola]|uniref:Uncharacterized protein n=1 Tax=Mytilinidion resinicola TaxID=574789 RepID=A0A6A6Y5M4_9PEZI|nr:uncharacterized protein BDZ99DRAFT_482174 [Mytilinidion resinicola]KAF2803324.1 hypothetical protein BDZ99DRAFT_482174 [Mytilinidion resinicola]